MLSQLWNALKGGKTYLIAASGLIYAAVHFFVIGDMTSKDAIELALGSAGLGALRHGLSTQIAALIEQLGPGVLDAIAKQKQIILLCAFLGAASLLSACSAAQLQLAQADISAGVAAACSDVMAAQKLNPSSPVSPWAVSACGSAASMASLVQNSATIQWLGQIQAQLAAASSSAPAAPAPIAAPASAPAAAPAQ